MAAISASTSIGEYVPFDCARARWSMVEQVAGVFSSR
jgi:hypothetical protein